MPVPDNVQRVRQLHEYIDRMPSLSTTVTKVLEICDRPATSPNDLNRVISLDPVLTGQVLKLINSAYYSLPNHITSLTRAIIMLGLNTVKNLALSTAVLGSLRQGETGKTLPMDAFWTHTICAGVTAKAMAARKGVPNNLLEEYFVAGLLHDLGKIPLCARFPGEYAQALELARLEQGPLERAEILVFGIDHGEVGRLIAEKWKLSATMVATLGFHHEPEQADDPHRELVAIVALANLYANVYEFGSAGDRYVSDHAVGYLLKTVGLSWQELADMGTTITAEIDKAQVFLRVSRGGA